MNMKKEYINNHDQHKNFNIYTKVKEWKCIYQMNCFKKKYSANLRLSLKSH